MKKEIVSNCISIIGAHGKRIPDSSRLPTSNATRPLPFIIQHHGGHLQIEYPKGLQIRSWAWSFTIDGASIIIYQKNMKGREIIKKLEAKGWRVNRIKGSHYHMTDGVQFTTIPVHGSKDLDIGLIRAIERQTGVKLQ